jgi:hypothetical protein
MINLCLVVIATQFSETKKREMERMQAERQQARIIRRRQHRRSHSVSSAASSSAGGSTSSATTTTDRGGCYFEMLRYLSYTCRRAKRYLRRFFRRIRRHRGAALSSCCASRTCRCGRSETGDVEDVANDVVNERHRRRRRRTASTEGRSRHRRRHRSKLWKGQDLGEGRKAPGGRHGVSGCVGSDRAVRCLKASGLGAPRASPENSDIDLSASPRQKQRTSRFAIDTGINNDGFIVFESKQLHHKVFVQFTCEFC